jgi:hypothetical protein
MSGAVPAEAAEQAVAAVEALRPVPGRMLIVTRGGHPLWAHVVEGCRRRGWSVTHRVLAEDDRRWDPPAPDGPGARVRFQGERLACDLVLYHEPFGGRGSAGGGLEALRRLCGGGTAFVGIEFPHGLTDPALALALEATYLRALAAPVAALRDSAEGLAAALRDADSIEIHFGGGRVLRARRPWNVRTDFGSAESDHPILQLPLGEAWVACPPESVGGDLDVQDGPGTDRLRRFTVDSGRIRRTEEGPADPRPLVEIGFGVNPAARWMPTTALGEKAAGSMHVGFGDSTLIGGGNRDDVHYDLPLPRTARLRLNTAVRGTEAATP